MDQSSIDHVKGVIESLLFINEKPVTFQQLKDVLKEVEATDLRTILNDLINENKETHKGMMIVEIAGGYQMLSNPDYAAYVRSFYKTRHKERLSKPALETLAIVAYKQPVTRLDVEVIRGVNSDGVISHLLDKELVKVVGRKDVPGKPYIYGTTKQFQEYFGLKSLEDLPALEDFPKLEPKDEKDSADVKIDDPSIQLKEKEQAPPSSQEAQEASEELEQKSEEQIQELEQRQDPEENAVTSGVSADESSPAEQREEDESSEATQKD